MKAEFQPSRESRVAMTMFSLREKRGTTMHGGVIVMGLVQDWEREQEMQEMQEIQKIPPEVRIPDGNVAFVSGLSAWGTPGNSRFEIEIGHVVRYQDKAGLISGIEEGKVKGGSQILEGKNAGVYIGIKRLIEKSVSLESGRSLGGKVNLELFNRRDRRIERSVQIDASVFTDQGFDLDKENRDNWGSTFNRKLSQILYEFQEQIGRFEPSHDTR